MSWKLQLVNDDKIFELGDAGYASSCVEHDYVIPEVRAFLKNSDLAAVDMVVADPYQALLNPTIAQYHMFRLVWGDQSPNDKFAAYPNGTDRSWTLYQLCNGKAKIVLSGSLPCNWTEMTEEEKFCAAEERYMQFVG